MHIIVDYYSPAMLGLKTDQQVLGDLVKTKAPAIGQLMDQYPGIWTLLVSRWFICLFIDILPIEVKTCIIDKTETGIRADVEVHYFTDICPISCICRQFCGSGTVSSMKALRCFSVLH